MVEREEPQPLIPQYSIRSMLAVTAVCAVLFSVFGAAAAGRRWALGVSIGLGSLVLMMAVYAAMFAFVWAFSLLGRRRNK